MSLTSARKLEPVIRGIPQNELGIRTDILDCCPKAQGMMMLIRTMSPQVIAVDEIGSREDLEAIEYVMNCGCKLVATGTWKLHRGHQAETGASENGAGKMVRAVRDLK